MVVQACFVPSHFLCFLCLTFIKKDHICYLQLLFPFWEHSVSLFHKSVTFSKEEQYSASHIFNPEAHLGSSKTCFRGLSKALKETFIRIVCCSFFFQSNHWQPYILTVLSPSTSDGKQVTFLPLHPMEQG